MLWETPIAGDPRTSGLGEAVFSALSRSALPHARYAAAGASGERTLKPGCGWERCLLASVLRLFIPLRLPCSISHYQQNVVSKTGQPSWTLTFCDFRSLHPLVNIILKMFFLKNSHHASFLPRFLSKAESCWALSQTLSSLG